MCIEVLPAGPGRRAAPPNCPSFFINGRCVSEFFLLRSFFRWWWCGLRRPTLLRACPPHAASSTHTHARRVRGEAWRSARATRSHAHVCTLTYVWCGVTEGHSGCSSFFAVPIKICICRTNKSVPPNVPSTYTCTDEGPYAVHKQHGEVDAISFF